MSYSETAIMFSKYGSSTADLNKYQEHPYPNSPNIIDINYNQYDLYDTRMTAQDAVVLRKLDLSSISAAEEGNLVSAVWKGMY